MGCNFYRVQTPINYLSCTEEIQKTGKILGILKASQKIKPKAEINETIDILKLFNREELPVDEISIKQKLELYNAL
jgi:hypothetical protein